MVLWFTGQPGSGKTTLTNRFIDDKLIGFMKIQPVRIVHIDGDDLRDIVDNKDYSEKGRRENITLAMNLARFMRPICRFRQRQMQWRQPCQTSA